MMIWGEEDRALGVELTRGTDEIVSDPGGSDGATE